MDKSELRFKYRSATVNTTIPDDSLLDIGEYYINTGSSFMYIKSDTSVNNGLLFPGIIYDTVNDSGPDDTTLNVTDVYKNISSKKYLVFNKYGANLGRFVPSDVSSIYVVSANSAEIRNNKIQVKVHNDYISSATSELNRNGSTVIAVIGYIDDIYKEYNQYGTSAIVKLTDIDEEGYATVGDVIGGYLLMKNKPSSSDIINHGILGMAWHTYRNEITLDDGSHPCGCSRIINIDPNEISFELYTPYSSICNFAVITVTSTYVKIKSVYTHGESIITIGSRDNSLEMSMLEWLDFALSWIPSSYGQTAQLNGIKLYPAKPSQGSFSINIANKSDINIDIINSIMYAGQSCRADSNVWFDLYRINDVPYRFIDMMGGLDMLVNASTGSIPVMVANDDNGKILYSPLSFIHGYISNDSANINDGPFIEYDTTYNFSLTHTFAHIHNIDICDYDTLLGGESINVDRESPLFCVIDYQPIVLNKCGKGSSKTATLRKYLKIENGGATFTAAQGDIHINVN